MTLIRVPRPQPRVFELEDQGSFALAMQDAEQVRRGAGARDQQQRVKVVIQVSHDDRRWEDWEEFWSGRWRPSWEGRPPQPTREDLLEAARVASRRFARTVIRSAI